MKLYYNKFKKARTIKIELALSEYKGGENSDNWEKNTRV